METSTTGKKDYLLPASIVIAAVLIAGAVIFTNGRGGEVADDPNSIESLMENVRPVSNDDHIIGDPKAPVVIVEFSDTECPFCKRFDMVMRQVMTDYKGQVAWVYRHFPIASLHSKAPKEAEATECAAELGGNEAFWKYTSRLYDITPSNNGLDLKQLPEIAKYVGLDVAKFNECLESGRHTQRVNRDLQDAVNSGGEGTPYSIVITKSGKKYPINGALPYENVKLIIDAALQD